jgi:hypothetical protein
MESVGHLYSGIEDSSLHRLDTCAQTIVNIDRVALFVVVFKLIKYSPWQYRTGTGTGGVILQTPEPDQLILKECATNTTRCQQPKPFATHI